MVKNAVNVTPLCRTFVNIFVEPWELLAPFRISYIIMNTIAHISVRDNRKSEFTEKPKLLHFEHFHWKCSESIYNNFGTVFICSDF